MARFTLPQGKFDPRDYGRLTEAIRNSVETYDFDSGWIATPADLVIQHKLGILPKSVLVYASSVKDGNPMQSDSFTACDSQSVTITGPLAFCRVLVDV
jgi:hypothetical protein